MSSLIGQTEHSTREENPTGERAVAHFPALPWLATLANLWLITGVFIDGWAHNHIPELETFFTPWHAILYSGFAATAAVLAGSWLRAYLRKERLPAGYGLGLFGVFVFGVGGVGDMFWHILFGVEVNVDVLLSPTHLALVAGGILIMASPLRASFHQSHEKRSFISLLPAIMSLVFVLSIITFITQYDHLFKNPWMSNQYAPLAGRVTSPVTHVDPWRTITSASSISSLAQVVGITGIIIQTGLLMGVVLYAIKNWRLPFGSLTILLSLNTIAMSFMADTFMLIPVALLAGLSGDLLYLWLKPDARNLIGLRLFAFFTPALLYLYYFLFYLLTDGIWWTIHFWLGAVVVAGVVGLFLSLVWQPPHLQQATK